MVKEYVKHPQNGSTYVSGLKGPKNYWGWGGEGGREGDAGGRRYGNVCICVADSLCYKAETNTPL